MPDSVKIICSKCVRPFRARAAKVKNGAELQCPNCSKLIIFDSGSEDLNIKRALKTAREIKLAEEDAYAIKRRQPVS